MTAADRQPRSNLRGYGPRPLKAGTLRLQIFVNTTGEVDTTFTPRLYKLD